METKIKLMKQCQQFYCDHCGGLIHSPEEGWVEFLSEPNGIGRRYFGFRIVHIAGSSNKGGDCLKNFRARNGASIELSLLTSKAGISELLDLLDEGDVLDPVYLGGSIKDMREFVELFRRITIPYYEQARQYWSQALEDSWFDSNNLDGIYGEETLKHLICEYSIPGSHVPRF